MKMRLILAVFAATGLVSAPTAFARGGAMACYRDSIPLTLTNFDLTLSFPLFDPNDAYGNGTNIAANLTSVSLRLDGELLGSVTLTNVGNSPATMNGALAPMVVVQRPDLSPLLTVMLNSTFGPVPVDGLTTLNVGPLIDTDSTYAILNMAPDLAVFTGPGVLVLPVLGSGSFFAEGGGGTVISTATTLVSASVDMCYHFGNAPEPGTSALLLCGLIGLLGRGSRESRRLR